MGKEKISTRKSAFQTLNILDLVSVGLSITGVDDRKDFFKNIGNQLDHYNTQPFNRKKQRIISGGLCF